jgi:hypothetical protein
MMRFYAAAAITSVVAASWGFSLKYLATKRGPVLDVQRLIDFGLQEKGRIVEGSFAIRNRGGSPLVIDQFSTSCGCIKIGMKTEKGVHGIAKLTLMPGEGQLFYAGIRIRGNVGQPVHEFLRFRTNDPNNADVSIEMVTRVNGPLAAIPNEINLGRVLVGHRVSTKFEIRDTGLHPGASVESLLSSQSDSLRIARIDKTPTPVAGGGIRLAVVEAVFEAPGRPGLFNADFKVKCAGQDTPALSIPFSAIIVPRFELVPASLLLPRLSGTGPIYEGKCLCRSWAGKELRLRPSVVPPGIIVKVEQRSGKREQASVTVMTGRNSIPYKGTDNVQLLVSDGDTEAMLTLPVSFWSPK